MNEQEFRELLAANGFETVVLVEREPGSLDLHTHPFEARGWVMEGELTIVSGHGTQHCGPGDSFHLAMNEPHTEGYGPQGVRYLAGRK
jgi:quercetin dioxygenase-like cupin family protein